VCAGQHLGVQFLSSRILVQDNMHMAHTIVTKVHTKIQFKYSILRNNDVRNTRVFVLVVTSGSDLDRNGAFGQSYWGCCHHGETVLSTFLTNT